MVCVYMPAYLDTIHPTLLLVSMHVWSSVLWNCFIIALSHLCLIPWLHQGIIILVWLVHEQSTY